METPSKFALGFFLILVIVVAGLALLSATSNDDRERSDDGPDTPKPTEPEKVPEPITRHSIIYDDGIDWNEQKYSYFYRATGEKAPLIEPNPKERHVFTGWKYKGQFWNFDDPVRTDMILKVSWSEHFTVDLDPASMVATVTMNDAWKKRNTVVDWNDGHSSAVSADTGSVSHVYEENYNTITVISYSGSETSTSSYKFTFYPQVVPRPTITEVHFFTDISHLIVKVKAGERVKSPQMPVQHGRQFLGWYTSDREWDFNEPITHLTALSARWKTDETLKQQSIVPVVDVTTVTGGTFLDASKTEGAAHYEWYVNGKIVDVSETMILSPEHAAWEKYGNKVVLKVYTESRSKATWEQYFPD